MPSIFDRAAAAVRAARDAFRGPAAEAAVAAMAARVPEMPGQPYRSTPGTIAADPPYQNRVPLFLGANMTPTSVASALRQAELGYMSRYSDLLSECREKVPHLQTVLATRELSIAGCPWVVEPKEHDKKRASKKAKEIADYVNDRISSIPRFGEKLQHLAGGIYFGRSALEIQWKRDERGIAVAELHGIHPKRLSYAVNWRIHLWDENGNEYDHRLGTFPGIDLRADYPNKFVVHEPLTMGCEIPTRQGLGRVLCYFAMFWTFSQRDWMQFAELFGRPWRVGFFDKALADEDDVALLKSAIQQMSTQTSAVLPNSVKFDLHQPKGQNRVHLDLRQSLNAEISKVVLGQTLTTEAGGTKATHALGVVHDKVKDDILDNDGRSMSETITRDLVYPMVGMTYGWDVANELCPTFRLVTESEGDLDDELKRVCSLVDRGMDVRADDARDRFTKLPKPDKAKSGEPLQLLIPLPKMKPGASAQGGEQPDGKGGSPASPKDGSADDASAKPAETEDNAPPEQSAA